MPPVDTFSRWLVGGKIGLANTIESNKTKFPELDYMLCDFINRLESFLSIRGFVLCCSVI